MSLSVPVFLPVTVPVRSPSGTGFGPLYTHARAHVSADDRGHPSPTLPPSCSTVCALLRPVFPLHAHTRTHTYLHARTQTIRTYPHVRTHSHPPHPDPPPPSHPQVLVPLVLVFNAVREFRNQIFDLYMSRAKAVDMAQLPGRVADAVRSRRRLWPMLLRPGASVMEASQLAMFASPTLGSRSPSPTRPLGPPKQQTRRRRPDGGGGSPGDAESGLAGPGGARSGGVVGVFRPPDAAGTGGGPRPRPRPSFPGGVPVAHESSDVGVELVAAPQRVNPVYASSRVTLRGADHGADARRK